MSKAFLIGLLSDTCNYHVIVKKSSFKKIFKKIGNRLFLNNPNK